MLHPIKNTENTYVNTLFVPKPKKHWDYSQWAVSTINAYRPLCVCLKINHAWLWERYQVTYTYVNSFNNTPQSDKAERAVIYDVHHICGYIVCIKDSVFFKSSYFCFSKKFWIVRKSKVLSPLLPVVFAMRSNESLFFQASATMEEKVDKSVSHEAK